MAEKDSYISSLSEDFDLNARYRSFVENSTEAIYCIVFDQPISVNLSEEEYLDQVYRYGYIDYVNDAYAKIAGMKNGKVMNGIRMPDIMPYAVPGNVESILEFKRRGFNAINLESEEYFENGEKRYLLNNANGVIENGFLMRVWCVSRDVTAQKKLEADLRSLAGRLIANQEEELSRLARELHDNLTQKMAVLAIEAGSLQKQPDLSDSSRKKIENIKDQLICVSKEIHNLSRDLHPAIIADLGLEPAVRSECNNFSMRMDLPVSFNAKDIPTSLPANISLTIYRIIQEGLKNIANHSQSKNAYVFLDQVEDNIVLMVRDMGVGFDQNKVRSSKGLGLTSMRERVRLVGGEITIKSKEGKGTSIEVIVPFKAGK